MSKLSLAQLATIVLAAAATARAGDWPQLLGPSRQGIAVNEKLRDTWPSTGPPVLWKKKVGRGFAGPAVVGKQVILFHRVEDDEVVEALDAARGTTRWRFTYPTNYVDDFGFDDGPRAVPTISGSRVYTHGAAGMIHCLDLASGEKQWSVDTVARFDSGKGFFGRACAPLVEGNLLILQVGGRGGRGIVALDKTSGRLVWSATDHEAGYASPVAATIDQRRRILCLTRTGLVVLHPPDGSILHQHRFRARMHASINAATPIVSGDALFLSASYGVGALALRVGPDGGEEIWSGDGILSSHYATPVHHRGFLYGFDGRQERGPRLRCVELATGKVRWSHDALGAGSLLVADDKLLILTEKGPLILAPARPDAFDPIARAQVLGFDTRAFPALAGGRLYARDKKQLVCLELGAAVPAGHP